MVRNREDVGKIMDFPIPDNAGENWNSLGSWSAWHTPGLTRYSDAGVYELGVRQGDVIVPVYVGTALDIADRLGQHNDELSHISDRIQAVRRTAGLEMVARYHQAPSRLRTNTDCQGTDCQMISGAEWAENQFLNTYNYAWNTRRNGQTRRIRMFGAQF